VGSPAGVREVTVMSTSGRCHGPSCQQPAVVDGGFCGEPCQARWHGQRPVEGSLDGLEMLSPAEARIVLNTDGLRGAMRAFAELARTTLPRVLEQLANLAEQMPPQPTRRQILEEVIRARGTRNTGPQNRSRPPRNLTPSGARRDGYR
jgi:hypothetical protein